MNSSFHPSGTIERNLSNPSCVITADDVTSQSSSVSFILDSLGKRESNSALSNYPSKKHSSIDLKDQVSSRVCSDAKFLSSDDPLPLSLPKLFSVENSIRPGQSSILSKRDLFPTKVTSCHQPSKKGSGDDKNDRPKRALSAYNLFFQYQRAMLLMSSNDESIPKKFRLPSEPPLKGSILQSPIHLELRRANIRFVLENNPFRSVDKKLRLHRKTHGKMGFTEMSKMMGEKWRKADPATKAVFDELHKEEKERYKRELREYNERSGIASMKSIVALNGDQYAAKTAANSGQQGKSTSEKLEEILRSADLTPFSIEKGRKRAESKVPSTLGEGRQNDRFDEVLRTADLTPIYSAPLDVKSAPLTSCFGEEDVEVLRALAETTETAK